MIKEFTKNRFVIAMIYVILISAFIFSCVYLIKTFDLFVRFVIKAFIPVIIGLFIAEVSEPLLKYLEKRKVSRTISAILILIVLNIILGFMLAEGIYILVNECMSLVTSLQNIDYDKIYQTLDKLFASVKNIYTGLPGPIVNFIQSGVDELTNVLNQIATMSLKVIKVIPATLKGITVWFFSVLSAFFFMRDRHKMRTWLIQNFSVQLYRELSSVAFKVIDSVVDYAKSQIILAVLMFLSGVIGLSIIKAPYFLVISLLLGLLSIIPIIGSGIILLPWIVGSFMAGDTNFGVKLLIVYLIILGIREFASIKIVASQVGISTFTTLVSIYAGVEVFGAWGFVIGPLLVVFLKAVYETGAIKKIRESLFISKKE